MTATSPPIDINPNHLETIQRILNEHVPDCEVRAFGSRAKWNAEDYSDLDLAVVGEQPLSWRTLGKLKDALEESTLPFRVDVLDWYDISEKFKKIIKETYVILNKSIDKLSEWKQAKLGDVANVSWGDTSTTKSKYIESGFLAYSAKGPDGYLPYADYSTTGIVLSAIGADCGKTWLAKGQWSCIKNTIRFWSTDPEVDTEFLYWITRDPDFWPKRGSAQPFISQGDARNLMISYPSLEQQRSIAHILGTLDDKIELNRRMNETLEAMAQALFKSWLIDFDPVRAKMEGRWRPGESLPGLPAHLYDLFPDRLVSSELGEIPEGWQVGCFGDTVTQVRDNELPSASPNIEFHHFSIPSFDKDQWPIIETGDNIRSHKSRVPLGVALLSKLNPEVERVWLVDVHEMDRAVCSTEFLVLRPQTPHNKYNIYFICRSDSFQQQLKGLVTGTSKSHQRVPTNSVLAIRILLPPELVVQLFGSLVYPTMRTMHIRKREQYNLISQRELLLPSITDQTDIRGITTL